MRTPKTDIESYLEEYYYATKALRNLRCKLVTAIREYEDGVALFPGHGYDAIKSKNKKITNPTQAAAIVRVDSLGAEVDRIQRHIADAEAIIISIEDFIRPLDGIEKEYVKYRYFENRSLDNVSRLMGYADRTLTTIRSNALGKLQGAYRARERA